MKHKILQYIFIILAITGIVGFYFYLNSRADQKINSSKVNNLTSGLVGYWTMDGADTTATTALDMSTNDNAGTITGTVTKAIGKIGQAFDFNGSTGYLTVGTNPNLGITTGATECAWIYQRASGSIQYIMHYANIADGDDFGVKLDASGTLIGTDFNTDNVSSTAPITLNSWQHVCATLSISAGINNDTFKIYINGNLNNEAVSNYNPYLDSQGSKIGVNINNIRFFNGLIDEARIYNRVLSASEITELYQQGQTKINASEVGKLTNGLTGYWSFDGADTTWTGASTGTVTNRGSVGGTHAMTNMSRSSSPIIGKIGQALNFNSASSQYISTALGLRNALFGVNAEKNPGTVSVWLKPTGSPVNASSVDALPAVVGDVNNGAFGISRGTVSGGADKIWGYNNWGNWGIVGTTFTVGEWTHIIFTKSATQLCIYKNGVQVECVAHTDLASAALIDIGRYIASYNGGMDELRFYNRVLSDSEITELYQQGQTKINASQANKLTNGLVGYWTMDGADTSWSGNTATLTNKGSASSSNCTSSNMSQSSSPKIGKVGQAFSFDGSDDYLNCGNSVYSFGRYNPTSFSFWFYPQSSSSSFLPIISKNTLATVPYGMYLSFRGSNKRFIFVMDYDSDSSNYFRTDLASAFSNLNNWYHIVVTYDGSGSASGVSYYVDGVSKATVITFNGLTNEVTNSENFAIGADAIGQYLQAGLDEVRVYSRALSQSEVTELYNMGR